MDGHRHEELSDESLEREIEAALDVDPSPEFLARLRTRVARERIDESWAWLSGWRWAGVALAIAAVAVAGLWIARQPGSARHDGLSVNALIDLKPGPRDSGMEVPASRVPTTPNPASAREVLPSTASAPAVHEVRTTQLPPAEPEVLISPDEAVALSRLVRVVVQQRVQSAAFPALGAEQGLIEPLEEIVLEPIAVSPLVRPDTAEGVRQ
jgi:hypothetical protein